MCNQRRATRSSRSLTRQIRGAREAVDGSINTAGVFGRRNRYGPLGRHRPGRLGEWGATLIRGDEAVDGPRRVVDKVERQRWR